MQRLYNKFIKELKNIEISTSYGRLDEVVRYNEEKNLKNKTYGIAISFENGANYKDRLGKNDDLVILHCYSINPAGADYLREMAIKALNQKSADLTDAEIKFYMFKLRNRLGSPTLNKELGLWESLVSFDVRWCLL